jgi:hypothetical protein
VRGRLKSCAGRVKSLEVPLTLACEILFCVCVLSGETLNARHVCLDKLRTATRNGSVLT